MIPRKDICQLEKQEKDRFLYAYSKFVKTNAYSTLTAIRERSQELWRNKPAYLVWHRAYLAVFERLIQFHDPLRSTLGNISVPYLAWEEWDEQTDDKFYSLVRDPYYTITSDILASYITSTLPGTKARVIQNPLYKPRDADAPVLNNDKARALITNAMKEHHWRRFSCRMKALGYVYHLTGAMAFDSTDRIAVLTYANADRHFAMWQTAGGEITEADYRSSLPPWTAPQHSFDFAAFKDGEEIVAAFLAGLSGKPCATVGSWFDAYKSSSVTQPSSNAGYVCMDVTCANVDGEVGSDSKIFDKTGAGDKVSNEVAAREMSTRDKITAAVVRSLGMDEELPLSFRTLWDIDTIRSISDKVGRIYNEVWFRLGGDLETKTEVDDIVQTFRVAVPEVEVITYRDMCARLVRSGEPDDVIKAYRRAFAEMIKPLRSIRSYWRDLVSLVLNPKRIPERIIGARHYTIAPRGIVEKDGWPVLCQHNFAFTNWGRNVTHLPEYIFFPRSRTGVLNIVKKAIEKNKKVRCCGFRHTWNDMYSESGEWLISMVNEYTVYDHIDESNDLQGIQFVGDAIWSGDTFTRLVRVGAGTTNEMLRQWCIDQWQSSNNPANDTNLVTLPFNVIMVEITLGGSNAPICHGAGITSSTLSDLVAEVEFVNAVGEIQTVRDPELLKSASGAFGLLGIVLSLTLRLDKLTYAKMVPKKISVLEAVPPPAPEKNAVPDLYQNFIDEVYVNEYKRFVDGFTHCCEKNYYSEWFWFTGNKDVWVNCWNNDGTPEEAEEYPCPIQEDLQHAMAHIAQIANTEFVQHLPPKLQTRLVADMAMIALPDLTKPLELINPSQKTSITTPLINGLHFRRGIHNMRVSDMEFEIPVPTYEKDGVTEYDWKVCMEAWWKVINIVEDEAKHGRYPQRLCLEMRITGGSNVTLAPQRGNQATCSIEVLTVCGREADARETKDSVEWDRYKQRVFEAWASIKDRQGKPLLIRSHWAKEWQNLKYRDPDTNALIPIIQYNRNTAYKDAIPRFRGDLEMIARAGGYQLSDMRKRFSNRLLDSQIFDM